MKTVTQVQGKTLHACCPLKRGLHRWRSHEKRGRGFSDSSVRKSVFVNVFFHTLESETPPPPPPFLLSAESHAHCQYHKASEHNTSYYRKQLHTLLVLTYIKYGIDMYNMLQDASIREMLMDYCMCECSRVHLCVCVCV